MNEFDNAENALKEFNKAIDSYNKAADKVVRQARQSSDGDIDTEALDQYVFDIDDTTNNLVEVFKPFMNNYNPVSNFSVGNNEYDAEGISGYNKQLTQIYQSVLKFTYNLKHHIGDKGDKG